MHRRHVTSAVAALLPLRAGRSPAGRAASRLPSRPARTRSTARSAPGRSRPRVPTPGTSPGPHRSRCGSAVTSPDRRPRDTAGAAGTDLGTTTLSEDGRTVERHRRRHPQAPARRPRRGAVRAHPRRARRARRDPHGAGLRTVRRTGAGPAPGRPRHARRHPGRDRRLHPRPDPGRRDGRLPWRWSATSSSRRPPRPRPDDPLVLILHGRHGRASSATGSRRTAGRAGRPAAGAEPPGLRVPPGAAGQPGLRHGLDLRQRDQRPGQRSGLDLGTAARSELVQAHLDQWAGVGRRRRGDRGPGQRRAGRPQPRR